jgi:nitrogen fixation protein NifU and related proteins
MSKDYTDKVLDYFRNPRNMGELKDADGIGKVGNAVCGDVMWIYIKVDNDVITDCTFKTFGCVAAIATSSVLTEIAKNKTLEEALKITNKDVAENLGGLPPMKMHCSLLAEEGLKSAVDDYRNKKSV